MSKARSPSEEEGIHRLPRGRHALPPAVVQAEQRRRLIAAVPAVAAERGYAAMSVADVVRAAAVSRNAFYANFANKQECFAAAVEAGHERLFAVLAEPCDRRASLEERLETRIGAALGLLASDPDLARMLFAEAPGAGREEVLRQHRWLRRYGELLRAAVPDAEVGKGAELIVTGGLATRIAAEMLGRRGPNLRLLTPNFVAFLLTIYGPVAAEATGAEGSEPPPSRSTEEAAARSPRRRAPG